MERSLIMLQVELKRRREVQDGGSSAPAPRQVDREGERGREGERERERDTLP